MSPAQPNESSLNPFLSVNRRPSSVVVMSIVVDCRGSRTINMIAVGRRLLGDKVEVNVYAFFWQTTFVMLTASAGSLRSRLETKTVSVWLEFP